MAVSTLLLLFALTAGLEGFEIFGKSTDPATCAKKVEDDLNNGKLTILTILLIVGPIASIVLLVLNIVIMRFIKNKLVAETEVAMHKCFEVLDNVLVEMMPRKIQKQLQAAIGGKSGKATDTKDSEAEKGKTEEGGAGEQSAVSQVSAQK